MIRFAFYGRLSTDDRQDVTLARPSQYEACERKVAGLGTITAEFFDQESGSHADRPELNALIYEARDANTRRFDRVVCFQTSRLSRDRVDAGLFERDLRRLGVPIVYVNGGDSEIEIGINQVIDQHMRSRLKEETRRGQRQNVLNGYRCGGRAPYGYLLEREPHPVASRARAGDTKSRLGIDPEQVPVVVSIYRMWVEEGLGTMAICDRLNAEGIPSPVHTNTTRNVKRKWSKNTVRAILQNPAYTGRLVWDRTDHSLKRERGGSPRRREQDEWVVSEHEHPALVSQELFDAAQARFRAKARPQGKSRKGQRVYLLSGFVRCASGHAPLAMFGRARFEHTYCCCSYGREYGKEAAAEIGHAAWLNVREDRLAALVDDFFEERLFGRLRMDKLAAQLDAKPRANPDDRTRARLTKQIADADAAIALQVRAIEEGVPARAVKERIAELEVEQEDARAALAQLVPDAPHDDAKLADSLDRLPDLSVALREAPLETKRRFYSAFDLQVVVDKAAGTVHISAAVDETVAQACADGSLLRTKGHGGGRIRTCEGRANAFTARPL